VQNLRKLTLDLIKIGGGLWIIGSVVSILSSFSMSRLAYQFGVVKKLPVLECLFSGDSPGDLVEGLLLFLGVAITQSVSRSVFSFIDGLRLELV